MIFLHIFDISKAYHQKDNYFLHKNQPHLNRYQYIPGFKNFFTLMAVAPDQDLEGCLMYSKYCITSTIQNVPLNTRSPPARQK